MHSYCGVKEPQVLDENGTGLGVLTASSSLPSALSDMDIRHALEHPIGFHPSVKTVFDVVKPKESVCLVVSDHTRKTAADRILPVLLHGFRERRNSMADMFVLFATGIHRHPTSEEVIHILGPDIAHAFQQRIFFHDPDDEAQLVAVGITSRGYPVRVNRHVMEAKRRVLLGAATYHYHAGFGGGRKSLVPGVASRDTIAHNHSLTLDPERDGLHPGVFPGSLAGNPVAEEMMESALLCRPDAVVNTVLTPDGRLVGVFAGALQAAHEAACRRVERMFRVDIREKADLVIATAGQAGNWIQSHKALYNASRAVKSDGIIIFQAPCPEGLGNERFRYWMRKRHLPEIYAELRKSPEVLGQTALSTLTRGRQTLLVTRMASADIDDLGIETALDMDAAVRTALERWKDRHATNGKPTYIWMPEASHTVPFEQALKEKA